MEVDSFTKSRAPVALVTGATGIIGPSICEVLRNAGWCVVASDRTPEAFSAYEITHGRAISADAIIPEDLADESGCQRVVKAAVEKLTETLAIEWGPRGIRANAIRVGWIPGTAFLRPTLEKLSSGQVKQLCDEILPCYLAEKRVLGGGSAEDIAHLIAFLASSQGSFIQGVTIPADGGLSLKTRPHPNSSAESAFSEWFIEPETALNRWLETSKSCVDA